MPEFILTADWHLRADKPRCRLDKDWITTQRSQILEVSAYANQYNCPIIIVGDIFNKAVVPEEITNMFLRFCSTVNKGVYVLAGNHDLPYHSIDNLENSSVGILLIVAEKMNSKYLKTLDAFDGISWNHFGGEIKKKGNGSIIALHQLVFESMKDIPPSVNAVTAQDLLDTYPDADFILTGDMHQSFHYTSNGKHVINPGHLNRQSADQTNPPIVYLVNTDKSLVKALPITDDEELVTDEYLKKESDREDRIEAFIEKIQGTEDVTLSFLDNIEQAIQKNKNSLDPETLRMIEYLVGGTE